MIIKPTCIIAEFTAALVNIRSKSADTSCNAAGIELRDFLLLFFFWTAMSRGNQKNVTWFKVKKAIKYPFWWRIYLTEDRQLARQELVLHSGSSLVLDQQAPEEESRRSTKGQTESFLLGNQLWNIWDAARALIDRFNKLTSVFLMRLSSYWP